MITEEIARLTGKLVFQVDNRPLMAFEKRLNNVIDQLRSLETLVNKKFNIKVQLDSRTLREQLAKTSAAKITLKDVDVSQEALAMAAKRITDKLQSTPITLNKIRVDIASLIETKKLVRTLLGQMQISIPLQFQTSAAEKMLRAWKKETESKFKLKVDADISQAKFLKNARESLKNASGKLGKIVIDTPDIKLKIDRDHLKQEIRDVLAQIRRETTIRVNLIDDTPKRDRERRQKRDEVVKDRSARGHAFGGGLMGAGMGFARGALPGLGAAFAIGAVNNINQQLVATDTALEAVSGDAKGYASNMKFLEGLTEEQGRNMRDIGPQFNSVLASAKDAIGNEGVQDLFRGMSKYGTVMGLDAEAMKGSFRAISQMFSKDKIQAEEAQGQLAERLPAAMQLLAEANNTDVKGLREQMQKGALDPKKVLPELAKIMERLAEENGAYAKALESTRVAQGRMNREFEKAVRIFALGGFDKGIRDFFTEMATGLRVSEPLIKALGGAFDMLMRPIIALIKLGAEIGKNWDRIAATFGYTGKQLATLSALAAIAFLPFGQLAIVIGATALALEDLMRYTQGKSSVFGSFLESYPEAKAAFDEFTKQAGVLGGYLGQAWDYLGQLVGGLDGLSFPELFTNTMKEFAAILKAINDMIDRFQMAGQYAEMKNPEGSTSRAMGGLQVDNMTAMAMGPDWARMQMEEQINRDFNNTPNQTPDGIPIVGQNMQALERWAERMLAIQNPQNATNKLGDMTIVVDVKGGILTSENLMISMEEPMKKIALATFGDVVNTERNAQSQVRQ